MAILVEHTGSKRRRWLEHETQIKSYFAEPHMWTVVRELTEDEERIFKRFGDGLPPEPRR